MQPFSQQHDKLTPESEEMFLNTQILPLGDARKVGLKPGAFKVVLGATDQPAPAGGLVVNYKIVLGAANVAVSGVDFNPLSGSVLIPAGAKEAPILVIPKATLGVNATKPLTLTLQAVTGYQLDAAHATINIIDQAIQAISSTTSFTDHRDLEKTVETQTAYQLVQTVSGSVDDAVTPKRNTVYRFVLRTGANSKERRMFKQSIEALKQVNPQWSVDYDWTQAGEDEAFTLIYKDEEYISRRVAYLASAALFKTV